MYMHMHMYMCLDQKLPTTYLCGVNCPANPGAWQLHGVFHKKLRKSRKIKEDGGVMREQYRETAESNAWYAAQTGDKYHELMAEAARYGSKEDWRRSAKACREAIALSPDQPVAYLNLGAALAASGHVVEAAQRYLEAKERCPVGSELWAGATAQAFHALKQAECAEVAKPEWWNDEELKALSARAVRVAPNKETTNLMRAMVLSGAFPGTERSTPSAFSAAELKEAAAHYDRSAALSNAPAEKAKFSKMADCCREGEAEALH